MLNPGWHPALDWLAERLRTIPEVDRVVLFGSRARGGTRERSDIDVAVDAPRADARAWDRIRTSVDQMPTLLRIDLIRLDRASPEFRDEILRDGVVLFARDALAPQPS